VNAKIRNKILMSIKKYLMIQAFGILF